MDKLSFMKKINSSRVLFLLMFFALAFSACKKNNLVIDKNDAIAPPYAKFETTDTIVKYFVSPSQDPIKIPVSITQPSSSDKVVNFTYTSNSAVDGQQYTGQSSLTIPAGQLIDSLSMTGIFAAYSGSRVDTVIITIDPSSAVPACSYKNKIYVIIRKGCPVVTADLLGDYATTTEYSPFYGNYTYSAPTTVSSFQQLTSTTGLMTVDNIWDYGWTVQFDANWADPTNPTLKARSATGLDGNDGFLYEVRAFTAGNLGTFSACDQTITLKMQIRITDSAWETVPYVVNMAR